MERYASQHGDSSVNGKTVKTSIQDVRDNNGEHANQTWFTGDDSANFHSSNVYQISRGETVRVTVVEYTSRSESFAPQVEFSNLKVLGNSSNGNSSAG